MSTSSEDQSKLAAARDSSRPQFTFQLPNARRRLLNWYRKQDRDLPWRRLHRKSQSPYPVWVSEIMLQQTVIKAVLPKFMQFMERYPTVEDLAKTSEEELRQTVAGLGYYRRFGNLHRAAQVLVQQQPFRWPQSATEWCTLPGIGSYTGNAIASIAFNEPAAVVDGNVERVFCRLLDWRVAPEPKLKKPMQALADQFLAKTAPGDFNQAVMELGQTVCTKSSPKCSSCPLTAECQSYANQSQELAPATKPRREKVDIKMTLGIFQRRGKTLLIRRTTDARFLKNSWGFPTFFNSGKSLKADGFNFPQPAPQAALGQIKHNITHHRITADVVSFREEDPGGFTQVETKWVANASVSKQLVSNLDLKAWRCVRR